MSYMFCSARLFKSDVSKWDVSSVTSMDSMFMQAVSFKHELCQAVWVRSRASQARMFDRSPGSISSKVCESASTPSRQYVSRRPIPDRELIGRMPTSVGTSDIITSTIASTMLCPKCGSFAKSGRASCCAPGGAWYKNCGGAGNRNADHSWFEGAQACKRKSKGNQHADA